LTIPHYGKREAGGLTAASPGDTLYFAFGAYNDSGDSEVLTGLAVTDIEVIKNGAATVRATDSGYSLISDTGMVGDRAGLYRVSVQLFNTADDASFYATGSWYQAFVDAVTIDGRTVRFWLGSWEIGRRKVDVVELDSDTGQADLLGKFASLLNSGGAIQQATTSGALPPRADTTMLRTDTGAADLLSKFANLLNSGGAIQTSTTSAGFPPLANVTMIRTDTGAANQLSVAFANGFNDTGINDRLGRIGFDVDTGLRAQISDVDTGLHDTLADYDTGMRALLALRDTGAIATAVWAGDTGLRAHISDVDTGLHDTIADLDTGLRDHIDNTDTGLRARINTLAEDTGGVNINSIAGDTGAAAHLAQAFAAQNTNSDTGLIQNAATIRAKTDSLTFTVAGQVDSNIQYVNDVQVNGTGASGDEWGP
jgi:hypothetical protein